MASPSKWVPIGAVDKDPPVEQKPKRTTIDIVGGIYCHICHSTFGNKKEFDSHYVKHGTGTTDFVYTCVVCHKEIVGYPSFRGHCYLMHVTREKFKCEFCQRMFSKQCVLQTHIKNVHESMNKCTTCHKKFSTQNELYLHKITHKAKQDVPPYDCQVCSEAIETSTDCESHIEDHCAMFYSCPICEEDIPDIQNAATHLTIHFGNVLNKETDSETVPISNECAIDLTGGIYCHFCDSSYKSRSEFDSHFLIEHPGENIVYSCNICGNEYGKYLTLANHCYGHTARDRFECEECFKTFPRLSLLLIHMEGFHATSKPLSSKFPYTCRQCNHGFMTNRRLKDHYRDTHEIFYNQCSQIGCNAIFETPKDLIRHMKEHNSNENCCTTCGLRFNSLAACEKHIQVHKKKQYICPVCNKKYGEKYLIVKHAALHFTTAFHVCKVCGKIYNIKSRLVEHMKVHNEVKPYICSYCDKGFIKEYLLQQHMNIHTGQKPYKCTACPKAFASYPNWVKHLKNMHNIREHKMLLNENNNQKPENVELKEIFDDSLIDSETSVSVSPDNAQVDTKVDENDSVMDMSIDMNSTAYSFEESNESSQCELGEIDPEILELLEENLDGLRAGLHSIDEIRNELLVTSSAIQSDLPLLELVSESAAVVPPEYGPEFVGEGECARDGDIRLGDGPLPHIDPRLTSLHTSPPAAPQPWEPPLAPQPWEPPIITKYDSHLDPTRFAVFNTDIY